MVEDAGTELEAAAEEVGTLVDELEGSGTELEVANEEVAIVEIG